MLKFLTNNIQTKILAMIIATVLWAIVKFN